MQSAKTDKFRSAFSLAEYRLIDSILAEKVIDLTSRGQLDSVMEVLQIKLQLAKTIANIAVGKKAPSTNYVPDSERQREAPITAESLGLSDKEVLAAMTPEQQDKFWADKMAAEFPVVDADAIGTDTQDNKSNWY